MTLRLFKSLSPSPRAACAAALMLMLLGGAKLAHAADENANAAPAGPDADKAKPAATPEAAPEATPKPAEAAAAPPDAAEPPPPATAATDLGLVERLPPTAYPEPVVRGLHGGSLWLNSQGLQWPYLPETSIGVSGYAWLDTTYKQLRDGNPTATVQKRNEINTQGRFLLRVTPTYSAGDWFVQGQAELVVNKDQTQPPVNANADDVWIRAGKWNRFDVTIGRFEAFEVYHLGMGLDINTDERKGAYSSSSTPPALYGASFLFYRPDSPSDIAFHVYPNKHLRFELLGQVGNSGGLNTLGVRPAAIFDLGWLKLKAAGEYESQTQPNAGDQTKVNSRGVAGSAQFVFDPFVEFGANAGYALVDLFDQNGVQDPVHSNTERSLGGFANARVIPDLLVGVGVNDAQLVDKHLETPTGKYGRFEHLQTFGAVQYFWQSQLMVKLVVSYAKADFDPTFVPIGQLPYNNKMLSYRLRFQYLF